ncbi:hypothetical protein GALMADRAFT_146419 [Galerina marginata CBS 339.88]|uniref:Uncharacterized protein n=1 Tax=Galerina marginata (strain CBS 339.88) TaxID=685588 RepID=A0A067SC37_GALM3|nr:hypothetical protein GALMADRAFT_146419 [Galerina marginata CBS 339.88]
MTQQQAQPDLHVQSSCRPIPLCIHLHSASIINPEDDGRLKSPFFTPTNNLTLTIGAAQLRFWHLDVDCKDGGAAVKSNECVEARAVDHEVDTELGRMQVAAQPRERNNFASPRAAYAYYNSWQAGANPFSLPLPLLLLSPLTILHVSTSMTGATTPSSAFQHNPIREHDSESKLEHKCVLSHLLSAPALVAVPPPPWCIQAPARA